jgi:hypothetical protein
MVMKNILQRFPPAHPPSRTSNAKQSGVRRLDAAFDLKSDYSTTSSPHYTPNALASKPLSPGHYFCLILFSTISLAFAFSSPAPAEEITSQTFEETTAITVGNFVYAGNKTSICFADRFLTEAANKTNLNINPKYVPTKLAGEAAGGDLFASPFCVFSGEGTFSLSDLERRNLRDYLTRGGFVLASPGCSDKAWNVSFRRELKVAFPTSNSPRSP